MAIRSIINLASPLPHTSPPERTLTGRAPKLSIWKPEGGLGIILRWQVTEWCNYRCNYCPQQHERNVLNESGASVHAFDNHPVDMWINAIQHHFQRFRLSLTITGGEPLIDKQNMPYLLSRLVEVDFVACIRIDTNVSWPARWYENIDKSKLILMCTFHPSQVDAMSFWDKISEITSTGFRIGIINYVMTPNQISNYEYYRDLAAKHGAVLHPNPLWGKENEYSKQELKLFKSQLPEDDFLYRSQIASPIGLQCLYPALSYEMNSAGNITGGCHSERAGSIFDENLPPLFDSYSPCPHQSCVCLDKYSFLEKFDRNTTLNPLDDYRRALLMHREKL